MSILGPHIEHYEIGDLGGAGKCESVTRGWVMTVDRCLEHDHYIDLRSLGTIVMQCETDYSLSVGRGFAVSVSDDASYAAGGCLSLAAGDKIDIDAQSDATLKSGASVTLRSKSGVYIKPTNNPGSYSACFTDGALDLEKFTAWVGDNL